MGSLGAAVEFVTKLIEYSGKVNVKECCTDIFIDSLILRDFSPQYVFFIITIKVQILLTLRHPWVKWEHHRLTRFSHWNIFHVLPWEYYVSIVLDVDGFTGTLVSKFSLTINATIIEPIGTDECINVLTTLDWAILPNIIPELDFKRVCSSVFETKSLFNAHEVWTGPHRAAVVLR